MTYNRNGIQILTKGQPVKPYPRVIKAKVEVTVKRLKQMQRDLSGGVR